MSYFCNYSKFDFIQLDFIAINNTPKTHLCNCLQNKTRTENQNTQFQDSDVKIEEGWKCTLPDGVKKQNFIESRVVGVKTQYYYALDQFTVTTNSDVIL